MKSILRIIATTLVLSLSVGVAHAQFTSGQILTAAQLNSALAAKTSNAAAAITGGTITGLSAPVPLSSGGTGATTAVGATSQLQYLQGLTGSAARSVTSKLQDVVSILDFPGCDKTGASDSTACIQAALNSGCNAAYVPDGQFKYSTLQMPSTVGFTLFGNGPSSQLIQTGAGLHYAVLASLNFDAHQTIRDLKFDGTAGTGNTVDTSYAQTVDLLNLSFNNVPVGYSSLFLNGNPTSSTYMHDVRAKNIRIYSTTAGKAGIELGGLTADSAIDGFIMNGGFVTNYNLYANSGALTTTVSNSHPYNAAINVVKLAGNNNYFGWVNDTFDNALGDVFYSTGSTNGRFANTYIEGINSSKRGIVFDNSYNNSAQGLTCQTNGVSNATSCVAEINGSSGNKVVGAQIDSLSNYSTPYNMSGAGSYVGGAQGYSSYGMIYALNGIAVSAQAQSTVVYYGANGGQSAPGATSFPVPMSGQVLSATVWFTSTPASGQTFTVSLVKNSTTLGTVTVNNGSFSGTIALSPAVSVSAGDTLYITITTSATSGSTTPRYSILLQG